MPHIKIQQALIIYSFSHNPRIKYLLIKRMYYERALRISEGSLFSGSIPRNLVNVNTFAILKFNRARVICSLSQYCSKLYPVKYYYFNNPFSNEPNNLFSFVTYHTLGISVISPGFPTICLILSTFLADA